MGEVLNRGLAQINTDYGSPAASNVFSASITPKADFSTFRLTVAFGTTGRCNVVMINSAASVALALNGGASIASGCLYTFSWGVYNSWAYNIRPYGSTTINVCQLDEVFGGVV